MSRRAHVLIHQKLVEPLSPAPLACLFPQGDPPCRVRDTPGGSPASGIHLFGLARTPLSRREERKPGRESERETARERVRERRCVPFVLPGARSDWRVRPVAPAMAAFSRARDIGPIAYSRAFLGRRLLRVLHPSSRRCHYYYYYHRSARDVYLYELPVVPARLVRTTSLS